MGKKKAKSQFNDFFTPSQDPIDAIVGTGLNIAVNHGLNRFSYEMARIFGVGGVSVQDQIALNRSKMLLEKQQAETAKVKVVSEMEIKMYAYRLQEKEIAIQEKKCLLEKAEAERTQLVLPEADMVVDGALAIPQDGGGIVVPDGPAEGYQEWLNSLAYGGVTLILGKRGSGKTALAARIAEFISATCGMSIYWVGLPEAARTCYRNG